MKHGVFKVRLGARCTSLTKWLTSELTIWLSVCVARDPNPRLKLT